MKILTRYVLKEFLVPLAYCLTGFISIYILFELFGSFSRIAEAKLSAAETVRFFAGYLSPFFHYMAPAALMLATLYTMWNFCRHSELTAMRASGISLKTIVKPMIAVAFLMACAVAAVNEFYMPKYALWAKQLHTNRFDTEKTEKAGGIGYCNSDNHRIWVVNGGHDPACTRLEDVQISTSREDGRRATSVSAKEARYLDGEWWLSGIKTRHYGDRERPIASPVPALDALPFRCFPQFTEKPEDIAMQNSDAQFASTAGKFRYLSVNRDLNGESRESLRYAAWAQVASPFACIVITLLSIPAGISSGRQSVFKGVLGALAMFFSYHAFAIACMVLAKTGLMPPVPAALAPPLAFAALGVVFCFHPLGRVLKLMAAYMLFFAIYAASAYALERHLSVDRAMAHSLGATLPVLAAALCTCPEALARACRRSEAA